ncbi:MAG: M20/M25/M40 family metallo-hydrolase, partial [Clostridia bacterium]|nr:M20/M25/M40 family metallo-hydrolase [Clostridia bacterium]
VVEYQISVRSAEDSLVHSISEVVLDIAKMAGAQGELLSTYPAFSFTAESKLREIAMNTYKEMTGKDGRVVAVHGGTEAGVFRGMIPEIDIVGIGPASGGAHTPEEWVDLCSYERAFNLLVKILDKLCDEQ